MKKILTALLLASCTLLFAELPKSIELESGKVKLRLAAEKAWNINSIRWENRIFGIDKPKAHYGMAFQPQQSRFFIGSGHRESGIGEELVSLKITVDGKEVVPEKGKKITGNSIKVEKVSNISDFVVNYSFELANDRLDEKNVIHAKKLVKVAYLYCFMHPWDTRFTQFHGILADGSKKDIKFASDEKSPIKTNFPIGAWYEPATGLCVVTATRIEKGGRNAFREVWDRREYRKDYLTPFSSAYFHVEDELICSASTGFFCQKDVRKWVADAEAMGEKLR